jgi:hypothetical protein
MTRIDFLVNTVRRSGILHRMVHHYGGTVVTASSPKNIHIPGFILYDSIAHPELASC